MTVAQRYVEAFISKFAQKLATVEAKAKVNTLPHTPRKVQAKAVVDTLGNKKADQVQAFYNTVGEVKAVLLVFKVA